MSIFFETGTFDSQTQLLSRLSTFIGTAANANWSVAFGPAGPTFDPAEDRLVLDHQSGAVKFALETVVEGIFVGGNILKRMRISAFTGTHDDTLDMDAQPGGYSDFDSISVQQTATDSVLDDNGDSNPTLTSNYWFFIDDTYLIAALEIGQGSGLIQTFLFGQISLYPGATNGYVIHGTIPRERYTGSTGNRANYDYTLTSLVHDCFIGKKSIVSLDQSGHIIISDGTWQDIGRTTLNNLVNSNGVFMSWHTGNSIGVSHPTGSNPKIIQQVNWTTHVTNFIPPLVKGQVFSPHTTLGVVNYAPMGEVPGAFMIPLDAGLNDGDTVTIGPIDYLVFSGIRTRRVSHNNRFFGIAIQKNS